MTRPLRNNILPPSNGHHTLCRHCLAIFALRLSSQVRSVVTSKPSIGRDVIPCRYIDTAHCRNMFEIHTKFSSNSSYHSLSIKNNSRLQVYQYGTIYFPFQRWMKSMKYCLVLSMTPEKNISVSSETLYRSVNVRTTNCNKIKGKICRSELQLEASTPPSLQNQ